PWRDARCHPQCQNGHDLLGNISSVAAGQHGRPAIAASLSMVEVSSSAPVVRLIPRTQRVQVAAVYVIEDDDSMRRALARLLTCSNWPVRTFESAESFLGEMEGLTQGCLV